MEIVNFGGGPGKLPKEVLLEVQNELLNYKGTGMSVAEMSHRGADYAKINDNAQQLLKELLTIPDNYKVLFLQGGGTGVFAAVALNLIGRTGSADYAITGYWSEKAAKEAAKYGDVKIVTPKTDSYVDIPNEATWNLNPNASYLYYCSNETISGIEFPFVPNSHGVPLVADMSSHFLTQPIDVSKYGLIFAGAQKNIGPAGVCVVIIREDLLGNPLSICPSILDFTLSAKAKSIYNTPPCFLIYFVGKVFEWIKRKGGIENMAIASNKKSNLLYTAIDSSNGFYKSSLVNNVRSRVNVTFNISKQNLEEVFIQEAKALGMIQLKGHRSVGGLRVSLYNAVTVEEAEKLVIFMKQFMNTHSE